MIASERVLAAAREAFTTAGAGVSLDEIATRAGVGPGTVYRHFPTKQALFEAVIVARMRDLIADARDRDELHAALGELLTRAQQAGAVRADIAAADLAALLKGLLTTVQASADPGPPGRVLAVLCDGLRRFR